MTDLLLPAWQFLTAAPTAELSWWGQIIDWFKHPDTLLISMGPWVLVGVAVIVFIESGVLFPVLPGDSLIFAAGLLHGQLGLNMWVLILVILVAAFLGAQVGYWIGAKWGRRLFKDDARVLKTEYLEQAESFFARFGGRALVLGRFVPFVRTFVPIVAGMTKYPYGRFVAYNTLGALLWGAGITYAGTALGGVAFVHDNLSVIVIAIVFVSVIPMLVEYLVQRRRAKREATAGELEAEEPVATGNPVAAEELAAEELVSAQSVDPGAER